MKAAEISSQRGHQVTLFEKDGKLGGRFLLAAIPPKKQILKEFIEYFIRQLERLPVKIVLGKPFDAILLEKERPDAVILATGAKPFFPPIDGIEDVQALSVEEALSDPTRLGKKILIVGGGGIGAELADHLSEDGKEVTLIEMREGIALDLVGHLQHFLNTRLKAKGVQILISTKAIRFEKKDIWVEDAQGIKKLEGFDNIVMALGSIPNDELVDSIKNKVLEFHVIGDASKPREVMEAVLEGEEVALKI